MGASEGMKLALNVLGMLIAFVGLIAMGNLIGLIPVGDESLTLQGFSDGSFHLGILYGGSLEESGLVGALLGEKMTPELCVFSFGK